MRGGRRDKIPSAEPGSFCPGWEALGGSCLSSALCGGGEAGEEPSEPSRSLRVRIMLRSASFEMLPDFLCVCVCFSF